MNYQFNNCNIETIPNNNNRMKTFLKKIFGDKNNSSKKPPMDKQTIKMKINTDNICKRCQSIVDESTTPELSLEMMNEFDLKKLKNNFLEELNKVVREEQFKYYHSVINSLKTLEDHLKDFTSTQLATQLTPKVSAQSDKDLSIATKESEDNAHDNSLGPESICEGQKVSVSKEKRPSAIRQFISIISGKSPKRISETTEKNPNNQIPPNSAETAATPAAEAADVQKQSNDIQIIENVIVDEPADKIEKSESESEVIKQATPIDFENIPFIEEDSTLVNLTDIQKELTFLIGELNQAFEKAKILVETRNKGLTGEYQNVYITCNEKLTHQVGCQILKPDDSTPMSYIICTRLTQSIADYPPFCADNELISEAIVLSFKDDEPYEMKTPWSITLPVTARRSNSFEIALLVFDDDHWRPIDKVDVVYNLADQSLSTATAIIMGNLPMGLLAVTRPKREVFYMDQKLGFKFVSSVNPFVSITIPPVTDVDRVVIAEYSLRLNVAKPELISDWKEMGIPEIKGVEGISPIVSIMTDITHEIKRVDAPVIVKVPLPSDTFSDDQEHKVPVILPYKEGAVALPGQKMTEETLKPFQQILQKDQFIKDNSEHKISLFLYDPELEKWKYWENAAYILDTSQCIRVQLPSNGSCRFVAYRSMKTVKEDQLFKLSSVFRSSLTNRLVKILYGWKKDGENQKCAFCFSPIQLEKKFVEDLRSHQYTVEANKFKTARVFERAKILISIEGNVLPCSGNMKTFEYHYNSRLRNVFELTVKVADKFLQKSQHYCHGLIKFELERTVVKKTGGRAVGRAPSVKTTVEKEFLTDLNIQIPKLRIENTKPIHPTLFEFNASINPSEPANPSPDLLTPHNSSINITKEYLNSKSLEKVSYVINDEWEIIGEKLGISDTTIQTIKNTYPENAQPYNMLQFWIKGLKHRDDHWNILQNVLIESGYPNALYI